MWRRLSVASWFYCLEPSRKIHYGRMGGGESQFGYERMRWERIRVQKFTTMTFPSKWKTSQKAPFLKVSTLPLAPGTGNSVLAHGLENFTQAILCFVKDQLTVSSCVPLHLSMFIFATTVKFASAMLS